MNVQDAEEYTQSLGQIIAGSWRQIALANRLGVPKALGMKLDQWVKERLGGYAKMSISEKKEAFLELKKEGHTQTEIAEITGEKQSTVSRHLNKSDDVDYANAYKQEKKLNENNDTNDGDYANAYDAIPAAQKTRTENEKQRKTELEKPAEVILLPGLYSGDFRDISRQIADDSVQLIFTDPPYDKDSVQLYEDAAKAARRILKPGGSFIAYSGQRHLPAVLAACERHLEYWWTIAGIHEGGNQILNKLGVRCGWKPLVWFVKGTRGDVQNILSDIVRGGREKDTHEWQQAEEEARYYIEKLTTKDGLVVDFFVGGGTTCAAAKRLGRKWIGFEVDEQVAKLAHARINEVA